MSNTKIHPSCNLVPLAIVSLVLTCFALTAGGIIVTASLIPSSPSAASSHATNRSTATPTGPNPRIGGAAVTATITMPPLVYTPTATPGSTSTPTISVPPNWQQGKIAYVSAEAGHDRLYVLDLTDGAKTRLLTEPSGATRNLGPWWSPDGRQLAFYSMIEGRAQVALMPDLPGGTPRFVGGVTEADFISSPTWLPSGERIVAVGAKDEVTYFYIIDALSGRVQQYLAPGMKSARLPAWSPTENLGEY